MPILQDSKDVKIERSTFVDIARDQVINYNIQFKYNLPYAEGASWNETRGCLMGTRVQLLEDIMHWVTTVDGGKEAQIALLVDVAGSGKSAIAHTIAQRCYEMGVLGSSFFFDRDIAGRNGPEKLFITIALDLAGLSKNVAEAIDLALEQQRSLVSAALSRQFDELILKPFQRHPVDGPVVIVIDALDESYDSEPNIELLTILRDRVRKLPGNFRIFITSRPLKEIDAFLSRQHHISRQTIHIYAKANLEDIAIYAKTQLKEVAIWGGLGDDWPDGQLLNDFIRTAEGLFLWVSTVCKYLRNIIHIDAELRSLVSRGSPQRIPAEDKMDKLYLTILKSCNWDDADFVDGYKMIMGAIIAAKSPLSIQALQALHSAIVAIGSNVQSYVTEDATLHARHELLPSLRTGVIPRNRFQLSRIFQRFLSPFRIVKPKADSRAPLSPSHSNQPSCIITCNYSNLTVPVSAVLRPLGSLLTGLTNMDQPVRILHLSFRDFVTVRAQLSPTSEQFYLNEKEHSQRLALLCLLVLNENLREGIPGTGYLIGDESVNPGIPEVGEGRISEEVWYACRFWPDHILDEIPVSTELIAALRVLLSTKIVFWIEIVTTKGKFRNLRRLREWLQCTLPNEVELINTIFDSDLASSLSKLSGRLLYMDRREEALDAIQESVEIRRNLAKENPVAFNSDLARALHQLSIRLSDMGHRDEALDTNQEAVERWRKLAMEQPETFNPDLASSLSNLAIWLSNLGRKDEALRAIQQAVNIWRKLAIQFPEKFNANLAYSLHTHSICLSSANCKDEALDAIQQAVDICRKLAAAHPAVYHPQLARCLINLSNRLSAKSCGAEALGIIQEAVEILHRLAAECPAEFNPDLAMSLHQLSRRLFKAGRQHEALGTIQQALTIQQKLATERPAAFNVDLAYSLHHLAVILSGMGREEEALDTIQNAVEIRRGLAKRYPLVSKKQLTWSLNLLSRVLSNLGKDEEAQVAREEANTLASL